jgi:hypothetical protein
MVPETAAAANLELSALGPQLHGLQDDLHCLQAEARGFLPLAPLFGWLPKIGPEVAAAPDLMEMAQSLVDGGVLIFDSLSPLLDQIGPSEAGAADDSQGFDLLRIVNELDAARPSLVAGEQKLQRAADLLSGIDRQALSPRIGRLLDLAERYLPLLHSGVRAAQIAPELLGQDGPRTYLILAQNDDELRPTGGWISGMGLVHVSQGQIGEVSFGDSWAVDNMSVPHDIPPESLYRALWAEMWLFRDANWSPDFPTSAQIAERILKQDQGIDVDGVIAVDQKALRMLVSALEPLAVDSSEEPITAANVLSYMRESWTEPQEGLTRTEGAAEWTAHRKDFMSELVEAILDKMENQGDSLDLLKLGDALRRALAERHILAYLHNPQGADLLAAQGWNGALADTQGDYLQVVDANVGFNKVDPNVQRSISYHVSLTEPAQAQAEAVVFYENNGQREVDSCLQAVEFLPTYTELMHGCYWNYVRFYVPEGAVLLSQEREPLPAGSLLSRYRFAPPGDAGPDVGPIEKGKSSYGLFFVLGPGLQREVRMAWQLPDRVVRPDLEGWRYQLTVQKQSGTPAIPLRVTVSLPADAHLVTALPSPTDVQGNVIIFDLSLGIDQSIDLVFQDAGG